MTKESLASLPTLAGRASIRRPVVRPVSRVWFDLTDSLAFDRCIELALNWMESRAGVQLPKEAWTGQTFDVTDHLGANPAKALRVTATDGALWAARLDWPDPDHPRTWVSEYFAERRLGGLSRFGSQLTCVIRGESPPFPITTQGVVRDILQNLSAEADGRTLSEVAVRVSPAEVPDLVSLLYQPTRRLPVIVISDDERGPLLRPDAVARRVSGAAHVFHLPEQAAWALTRALGKRMSVFNGAVRMYMPGLSDDDEDPNRHSLWFVQRSDAERFVGGLASRVLPLAFLNDAATDDFPRFAALRDELARRTLSESPVQGTTARLSADLQMAHLEQHAMTEERDVWESLAREEMAKAASADAEIERLKQNIARLQSNVANLKHRLSIQVPAVEESEPPRPLTSYDELEEWADEMLGDQIVIHSWALKDCRKNGHASMLSRIESALLIMRDYMLPARTEGGNDRRILVREKLGELGMEDTACFVDRTEAKRTPGYSVQHDQKTYVLADHIKYGNGYDNANQVRIYYAWDALGSRFIIGKMPSHLRNNLTN